MTYEQKVVLALTKCKLFVPQLVGVSDSKVNGSVETFGAYLSSFFTKPPMDRTVSFALKVFSEGEDFVRNVANRKLPDSRVVGPRAIDGRGLFLVFGCKCIVFYSIFLHALILTGTGKHHVFSIFAHITKMMFFRG